MKKPSSGRRKVIQAALGMAGTTAVYKWKKPIVNTVFLPAHAQTSVCLFTATEVLDLPGAFEPQASTCDTTIMNWSLNVPIPGPATIETIVATNPDHEILQPSSLPQRIPSNSSLMVSLRQAVPGCDNTSLASVDLTGQIIISRVGCGDIVLDVSATEIQLNASESELTSF